jgi:hypothetical protein
LTARAQPRLGLVGLLLVVPIAALLAVGAGGPERSARVLGPVITAGLALIAMVAFWWENWPGTRLRASWSGWFNTALIAAGAVAFERLSNLVVADRVTLAAGAFVAMLELTLVGEGWPLHRPGRIEGVYAVAASWAIAAVVYVAFADVRHDVGPALIVIGAWQALFFVAWQGWPFSAIAARAPRLICAHAAVLAGGVGTYLVVHDALGVANAPLAAAAACFVSAALLVGMQFEDWLGRTAILVGTVAMTVVLDVVLHAIVSDDGWVIHVGLNALGVSIILHVAIGRRWPFAAAP